MLPNHFVKPNNDNTVNSAQVKAIGTEGKALT